MAPALPRRAPRKRERPHSTLVIRNVVVGGHRTSVRLEPVMWDALLEIARRQQTNVNQLVTEIDRQRYSSSLTAAIRVYIVDFYRSAAAHAGQGAELQRALPH
ncbi:MAG: ribbon-helix-helix domain-containing protein [Alphaproteobacteria bacterium]|nr:ribbon-helix-helix domain-containing protein [Alphaproteobacteria bacterium]MBV9583309.1 ribbon-helix-helix domain-containing protein [Alphaproteobacteria bacterium]